MIYSGERFEEETGLKWDVIWISNIWIDDRNKQTF